MSDRDKDTEDLPALDQDTLSSGAAADSADATARLKGLPRLLRYAKLVGDHASGIELRLAAEIEELCPRLHLNVAWSVTNNEATGLALAEELDLRAVTQDESNLRSLADCVRLLSLPTPVDATYFDDYQRVSKSLLCSLDKIAEDFDLKLIGDLERFIYGWAALPACTDGLVKSARAAGNAAIVGWHTAEHRIAAAKADARKDLHAQKSNEKESQKSKTSWLRGGPPTIVPDNYLVVARLSENDLMNARLKEITATLKGVINVPLPLTKVPPLQQVRATLLFEFPYARDTIDFALADLVGRTTVRLRPLILLGGPGAGKSRFGRRLGEILLGGNIWRTDASRADGSIFGGTDRRWHSAEPCHPFLAVARAGIANPLILIDEIEKAAAAGFDHGRFWDALLGLIEPETSSRYPDPALQTELDLSHISYIATANSLDLLPSPLRDRFRVVKFPTPGPDDLDALLPAVIADLARESGLDQRWITRLDGIERTAVARHWRGGSVRRLRRAVDVVLRERDRRAPKN